MTGTEAVDYLGLQDACREWLERDKNLSIVEFAEDRGYYTGEWFGLTVEYAQAQVAGFPGYDDYEGDLDRDLAAVAEEAIEYLTDNGILPNGYGYLPEHYRDGYGLLPTTVGEGS